MFIISTLLTLLICTIIVLLLCLKLIKPHARIYMELRKLPGPPTKYVILGNILWLRGSREYVFAKLREWSWTYYPIYGISFLHVIVANLQSPEDCELVMSNSKHIDKGRIYEALHGWFGNGLFTSTGKLWQSRRKVLTPAFHFGILQKFVLIFNEETEKLIDTIRKQCHEPLVTLNPLITKVMLKTITETAMGVQLQFADQKELAYKRAITQAGEIFLYRVLHPWLLNPILNLLSPRFFEERNAIKTLHRFVEGVIRKKEKTYKEVDSEENVSKSKRRLAMLDLLLTAKNKNNSIDEEGIRDEVTTFMFAGHDTSATAVIFSLMMIACHKDVQDRIVDEMREVLGDLRKKPTCEDLQELKYMDQVIKEVLRLYPSVPVISRKLGEDLKTGSGYLLPKGSIVLLNIFDLHHDQEIYPDPETFDPDRFLPENCKGRHPFSYLPFSAGPRNCLGFKFAMMQMKVILCGILADFVLEPVDTPDTVVLVIDIILRTKDSVKVKFVPRH